MNQKIPTIIGTAIIIILAFAVGYFVWLTQKNNPVETQIPVVEINPIKKADVSVQSIDETANWQTYKNNELGFEFSYPTDFGEVNFTIRNGGDAGKLFYGEFTQNKSLIFGGIDYDFAEGRGGSFLDTQGFIKRGGEYYKKFVQSGTQSIEKDLVKEITIDGMDGIIIQGKNYDGPAALPSVSERGALLNLNGERFKGIGFLDTNIKELSSEVFDQIISTFKFTK